MEKSNKLAIIIYSCERNSDMWEYFSILFRKYWKDCPYQVLLVTDHFFGKNPGVYDNDRERYVFDKIVVDDNDWAHMLKSAIKAADTPYASLWMDDYLLCDYIDNQVIEEKIALTQKYHAGNIRLVESPMIPSKQYGQDKNTGYYEEGTAYSICTQVGIWDVNFLNQYMKDGWSAWDFERVGSIEIKDKEYPLLVTLDYMFPYEEGVRRGKWMDNGVRLCKRNGIKLDFQKRPAMSNWELCKIYFKGAVLEWNPTLVVKLQNLFRGKKA